MGENFNVTENEISLYKKEISVYLGIVVIPLNLICIAIMFMKGLMLIFPLIFIILIDIYFYRVITSTLKDIEDKNYVKKKGVLKRKHWGLNLNKFEYVLADDPEPFASLIARFNNLEDFEVVVVYTKNTKKIVKMYRV